MLALKPRAERYAVPDPSLVGLYIRVQPSGAKSFVTVARHPSAKQIWTTLGATDVLAIADARTIARNVIKRVREGLPAFEPKAETFAAVAANWVKRHVEANGLRTRYEINRVLDRYVLPVWGVREFTSIRRSDVAALLDRIQDRNGARTADMVLATVRSIANWYASRHDNYAPPIIRGMRRQSPQAQARGRILSDEEIRVVWRVADTSGTFGDMVKLALLTAQRRAKIITMRWADLSDDGWEVPSEDRQKGTGGLLPLPKMAFDIIWVRPRLAGNGFVFAGRGNGSYNGMSKAKAAFDAKLPPMPRWILHDLRRSSRSLMSRAGVRPDIAERVMGHAIAGIEGTYNRHHYTREKAEALRLLAGLIENILRTPADNVVTLRA